MSFNKAKQGSIIRDVLETKRKSESGTEGNFKVSFEHYDSSQPYGSSFKDWQSVGLLSRAFEVLKGYCCSPLLSQVDGDKFTIYGDFPPPEKTRYTYPPMVPPDAKWARIHINGKAVIVGHVVKSTFYVVFLDKTHKFYLSKRATAN